MHEAEDRREHVHPDDEPISISVESGEEVNGLEPDHVAPLGAYQTLPVVGLGGSAGCIPFLQTFFAHTAEDTGAAYVVILHLLPEHESTLAEVLQRSTRMPVIQVNQRTTVKPNTVYVIPPGKKLSMTDGYISLSDLDRTPGRRIAVDVFFRTLADTHGPRACAIVLSGTDSDGCIGIKRVKERGGLTVAQDPTEAMYDGMPRAAIATGMIDWVLSVREMPDRLAAYRENEKRIVIPPLAEPSAVVSDQPASDAGTVLQQVLSVLRAGTGRDFSYYKRPTVLRRIVRRMQVNGVTDLPGYLAFMRGHPGEAGALLQDLLISVTNFFRDRASFEALETFIPRLFKDKGPDDEVRVWVTACATGEEAYSIAMLLTEHADKLESPPRIQVFATDIDEDAIRTAREGAYPETIAADVSEERLRHFFVKDRGMYRVKPPLRGMVLFAVHDMLRDPPFSRLDLVSCRNLLIYLHRYAQGKVFEIFHFALRPEALLFLGSSESIDDNGTLFSTVDKSHRLYARRQVVRNGHPVLPGRVFPTFERKDRPKLPSAVVSALLERNPVLPSSASEARKRDVSLTELHFKLLDQVSPPSLVVDHNHEIVHLSDKAGRFLQFAAGTPSMNLLHVVNPSLRIDLRAALFQATQTDSPVELSDVPLVIDGEPHTVNISVLRSVDLAPDYLMVIFREHKSAPHVELPPFAPRNDAMTEMEKELEHVKNQLRDTVYQYEAGSEELRASNEELQAMNEELRSATEELETSREELQSINEELSTVNHELKTKVEEVSRGNSDLQNLMFSTNIATIFLDRELRIKRYTPASVALFNLIPTDFGRPLSDLTPKLEYPEVNSDAAKVLENLTPIERETCSNEGRHYLVRLFPYRTAEDQIAGVVLTFVDITRSKQAEAALKKALEQNETARKQIEAAAAAKDDFLAVLSHELRTPLTPVVVTVDALMRRTDLPERVRNGLEMIRRNIDIESRFIDDLLDLTRIARRKFEIVRNPTDLHHVIRDAIEISRADLESKEQELAILLDAKAHNVIGDATRLQQVVWNLLKNASKFAPVGGKINISTRNDESTIQVAVSDNGIGIEKDLLPRVFDAFSQGLDVTRDYGGLGLGLAISKATIDAHGGTITAQSDGKNRGAVFTLSLPLPAR